MRLKPTMKRRPTFAVVVDGECEMWYLQMLKRNERSLTVSIEPRIPQRKRLSEQFDIVKSLAPNYTRVFWIVDYDVLRSESLAAKKGAKNAMQWFAEYRNILKNKYKNVVVIVNDPCLEFWFLLHFEATSRQFDSCGGAHRQLEQHLEGYIKTREWFTKHGNDIYSRLKPRLADAINNARQLGRFSAGGADTSLSEMHLFFECEEFRAVFGS